MLGAGTLWAQPQTAADSSSNWVKILNAEILSYQSTDSITVQKLVGDVRLLKDSTYFYCDSAYIFQSDDRIEAYSRVRMVMPDSVQMKGDKLIYNSFTRVAEVFDHIELTDYQATLYTDRLTYYRNEDYGYYEDGGKLINDQDTLTSIYGYYYPQDKTAYFKRKVKLKSPDYLLETDTLGYNTETKIATFLAPTTIISDDGTIYTRRGIYDTEQRMIDLVSRSTIEDSTYRITADSIFYNDALNEGVARGNIIVDQTDSSMQVRGNYGVFNRKTEESYVTRNAMAIQFMEDDTMYLQADTLFTIKDTTYFLDGVEIQPIKPVVVPDSLAPAGVDSLSKRGPKRKENLDQVDIPEQFRKPPVAVQSPPLKPQLPLPQLPIDSSLIHGPPGPPEWLLALAEPMPRDSAQMVKDSLRKQLLALSDTADLRDTVIKRIFKAYHHVSIFMNDLQGRADSLVYFYDDSTMNMFHSPVLWSDENQLTGDTIRIWMKEQKLDSMWVGRDGFLISREDTVGYNQVKGKEIRAKFTENELSRLHVIGNSESIYFFRDDNDSVNVTYRGMNKAFSQEMMIYMRDNKARKILFLAKPEGTFYPMFMAMVEENKLDGMNWRIQERPERPDIFPKIATPVTPPSTEETEEQPWAEEIPDP